MLMYGNAMAGPLLQRMNPAQVSGMVRRNQNGEVRRLA